MNLAPIKDLILHPDDPAAARQAAAEISGSLATGQELAYMIARARAAKGFNAEVLGKVITPQIIAEAVEMGQRLDLILGYARDVTGFTAADLDKIVTSQIVAKAVEKGETLRSILIQARLVQGFNAAHLDTIVTPEIVARAVVNGQPLPLILAQVRQIEGMTDETNDAIWTHTLGIDPVNETLIDVGGAGGGRGDAAGKRANFRRPHKAADLNDHLFGNPNGVHMRSERMPPQQAVLG